MDIVDEKHQVLNYKNKLLTKLEGKWNKNEIKILY